MAETKAVSVTYIFSIFIVFGLIDELVSSIKDQLPDIVTISGSIQTSNSGLFVPVCIILLVPVISASALALFIIDINLYMKFTIPK